MEEELRSGWLLAFSFSPLLSSACSTAAELGKRPRSLSDFFGSWVIWVDEIRTSMMLLSPLFCTLNKHRHQGWKHQLSDSVAGSPLCIGVNSHSPCQKKDSQAPDQLQAGTTHAVTFKSTLTCPSTTQDCSMHSWSFFYWVIQSNC